MAFFNEEKTVYLHHKLSVNFWLLQCKGGEMLLTPPLFSIEKKKYSDEEAPKTSAFFRGERRRGSFRGKNPLHPARWAIVVVKRCPNDDPRFPFKKKRLAQKEGEKRHKRKSGKDRFVPPIDVPAKQDSLQKRVFEWRAVRRRNMGRCSRQPECPKI